MPRQRVTQPELTGKKRRTRVVGERLPDVNRRWTPEDVVEQKDVLIFAAYCQQIIGVGWPNLEQERILRKRIKDTFAQYPRADWGTLVKLAQYCRDKRFRPENVWKIFMKFNEAIKAGVLPELLPDAPHPVLEEQIRRALDEETDPQWRRLLVMATGENQQRKVLTEWMNRSQTS